MTRPLFECKHCRAPFFKERTFLAHRCRQMERLELIQTAEGQRAYQLYKTWFACKRQKAPDVEVFMQSDFFSRFIKLEEHLRLLHVTDPKLFMEVMISKGVTTPSAWRQDTAYQYYIDHLHRGLDPEEQASRSIETLAQYADDHEVPMDQLFKKLPLGKLLELIHQRQVSPWLLFNSSKFKTFFQELSPHEQSLFSKSIDIGWWTEHMSRTPKAKADAVKQLVQDYGF